MPDPMIRAAGVALALALVAAGPRAARAAPPAELAARVYERLCALEGNWIGTSTKGWTERVCYARIAAGSVLMETSFGAHPDETMVTMIHPDGDRLLLTHYCVAKNQPRLALAAAKEDLSEVVFEFLDGTNLPTRDRGHMDEVIFRFAGPDKFTSRWTWYQDGQESWMEEIVHTRVAAGSEADSTGP